MMEYMVKNLIKKYVLLRIRMKISYMAFQWKMTISEFLMNRILSSYQSLLATGKIRNPYPDPKASQTIYAIIMGSSNFKAYAEENIKKLKSEIDFHQEDSTDHAYTEQPPELLVFDEHIEKALSRNKASDIFKNI
jgi:hypothetical protein